MQVINTNIMSLNSQRNLGTSGAALAQAIQRLSSGLRINSAKDDAAGLAISERFTTQIRGINVAARNANDGISLAQTAEGALGEVSNNLQRMRELAVQSANATNSASDRQALQAEFAQLQAEVNRVATQSEFNGTKLLDGSFTSQTFQIGANNGETITVSKIADSRIAALGNFSISAIGTATGKTVASTANGITAETNLTVTVGSTTTSSISYAANASATTIAAAINTATSGLGVTATATNTATLDNFTIADTANSTGAVTFTLNGTAVAATVTDQNDLSSLVNAVNALAGTTGVTATFTNTDSKGSITLTTTDGRDINVGAFAVGGTSNDSIRLTNLATGGTAQTLTEGGTIAAVAVGTITLESSKAFSVGGTNADVFATAGTIQATFASVAGADISTTSGATSVLKVIDQALTTVNGARADMGAIQNRFTSVIANLQTTSENLTASRSRIRDADFAAETAELTRTQILQQAGVAMLAQANQAPQTVLALLR